MTDQPVREPFPPDTERDRSDEATSDDLLDSEDESAPGGSPVRPSAAEGGEEDAGERPPRPSQAEGDRGDVEA